MSPEDSVRVLAVARAAYPGMSLVEGQAALWHGALGDLRADECVAAIVEHAKQSQSIVTVADIRGRVIAARRALGDVERSRQLAASHNGLDLISMPDSFRSSVAEHRRRAEAARPPKDVRVGYVAPGVEGAACSYGAMVTAPSDARTRYVKPTKAHPDDDDDVNKWWQK